MNSIKLQYGERISRIGQRPETLESLRSQARETFSQVAHFPSNPNFHYVDPDGDTVTIASDRDLVEAYVLIEATGKTLKLVAVPGDNEPAATTLTSSFPTKNAPKTRNEDDDSDEEDELDKFAESDASDEEGELVFREEAKREDDPSGMDVDPVPRDLDRDRHHHGHDHHRGHGRGHRGRHGRHHHHHDHEDDEDDHHHGHHHHHGRHRGGRGGRCKRRSRSRSGGRRSHSHSRSSSSDMDHDHRRKCKKERKQRKREISANQKAAIKAIKRDGKSAFDSFEFPAGRSDECKKLWKMVGRVSLAMRKRVVDLVLFDKLNETEIEQLAAGHARDLVCKRKNPEVPEIVESFRLNLVKMFAANLGNYQQILKEGDPRKEKKGKSRDGTVVRSKVANFVFGLLDKKGCHVRWAIRGKIAQNYCLVMSPEELQIEPVVNFTAQDWENKTWEETCQQVYIVLLDTYPDYPERAEDVKAYMLKVGAKSTPQMVTSSA